jgi:ATP-dependent 26S proteasome regulatory subunit
MLTAKEVGHQPPPLLRSGRVELWLEMRLPDEAARAAILGAHLAGLPAVLGAVDVSRLAAGTAGFTGADLKRLAEDGKLLLARDKARRQPLRPPTDYFLEAIATVSANKRRYADAEARARRQRPVRGPHFDHVGAAPIADGEEN